MSATDTPCDPTIENCGDPTTAAEAAVPSGPGLLGLVGQYSLLVAGAA